MNRWFPRLYDEELLFSVCARFAWRMGYSSHKAVQLELFGSPQAQAIADLPCRLEAFSQRLPEGWKMTPDKLIENHTLFPFYRHFLPQGRAEAIRRCLLGNGGRKIHCQSGITAGRVAPPTKFRICRACLMTDLLEKGDGIWRRLHQVTGCLVCPIHMLPLQDTSVARTSHLTRHRFFAVPVTEMGLKPMPAFSAEALRIHARLGRSIQWLLSHPPRFEGPSQISLQLKRLLDERDYVSAAGRLRLHALAEALLEHFGTSVLKQLQCTLPNVEGRGWLGRLIHKPWASLSPIRYLLLIDFLGHSVESFFDLPFNGLERPRVRASQRQCKSIPPAMLGTMWLDRAISVRQIARHFRVDSKTVTRKASQLELPFPREGPRPTSIKPEARRTPAKNRYEEDLSVWRKLRKSNPACNLRQLREMEPALFARLYRRNRDAVVATAHRRHVPDGPIINWDQRDASYLANVRLALARLQNRPSPIIRLSITSIAREAGLSSQIQKNRHKLPRTMAFLHGQRESTVEFGVRRIQSRRAQLGPMAKPWVVARSAGLSTILKKNQRVRMALAVR